MNKLQAEAQKTPTFEKIVPELDMTTSSIGFATINNLQITTNKANGNHYPFYLTNRIEQEHCRSFEVEILTVGSYNIWVGVVADTLKNGGINCYNNADSLVVYFHNGSTYLQCEGKQSTIPTFQLVNGYRILVKVNRKAHTMAWELSYPVRQRICEVDIPNNLRTKTLLPAVHLHAGGNIVVKFL